MPQTVLVDPETTVVPDLGRRDSPVAVPPSVDPNNAAAKPARSLGDASRGRLRRRRVGPPWAASTRTTGEGYVVTDVGCASSTDAVGLDIFFAERVGPMIGSDYQHVYPLGGDRYLWLFQDTFVDHTGGATKLNQASFIHNSALLQTGKCFQSFPSGLGAAAKFLRGRCAARRHSSAGFGRWVARSTGAA